MPDGKSEGSRYSSEPCVKWLAAASNANEKSIHPKASNTDASNSWELGGLMQQGGRSVDF